MPLLNRPVRVGAAVFAAGLAALAPALMRSLIGVQVDPTHEYLADVVTWAVEAVLLVVALLVMSTIGGRD